MALGFLPGNKVSLQKTGGDVAPRFCEVPCPSGQGTRASKGSARPCGCARGEIPHEIYEGVSTFSNDSRYSREGRLRPAGSTRFATHYDINKWCFGGGFISLITGLIMLIVNVNTGNNNDTLLVFGIIFLVCGITSCFCSCNNVVRCCLRNFSIESEKDRAIQDFIIKNQSERISPERPLPKDGVFKMSQEGDYMTTIYRAGEGDKKWLKEGEENYNISRSLCRSSDV